MKHAPNPRTQEQLQKVRLAEIQARQDVRQVFTTEAGQRVLKRLHAAAGTRKPRFRFNPEGRGPNPITAAFYDGQASIVQGIQDILDSPEDEEPKRPAAKTSKRPV